MIVTNNESRGGRRTWWVKKEPRKPKNVGANAALVLVLAAQHMPLTPKVVSFS